MFYNTPKSSQIMLLFTIVTTKYKKQLNLLINFKVCFAFINACTLHFYIAPFFNHFCTIKIVCKIATADFYGILYCIYVNCNQL